MTQPVAGLTLFTLMVASSLRSVLAQLPTLQPNTAQALPQNFSGQQTAYILGGGERPGSAALAKPLAFALQSALIFCSEPQPTKIT
jgi:hypothetical protein